MIANKGFKEYIRSSQDNPCPICGDGNGKCQIKDDSFVMCMNEDSEVDGYLNLGKDKNGVWTMYSLTDNTISAQKRESHKRARELAEIERLTALKKDSLPLSARDKAIRTIHKELGLSRGDHNKLVYRGLTEAEINSGLFFSVRGYTQISDNIPSNLAGVWIDKDGKKYLNYEDGYACPAFDFEGKAIGWQYRNNLDIGAKYIWAKGLKSSHLPNGELPITFAKGSNNEAVKQLLDEDLKPIFATEGLLKPYVASCRLGVDTMGASGFNFSGSPEQVKEIISKGGYNSVVFPLDGGALLNPMIMNQLTHNIELFESLGCQVFIGWWGQISKKDKDFDEIESLNQVRLIDYEVFNQIAKRVIYREDKKKDFAKLKGFKADKTIDKPRFYADGATCDDEIDKILNDNKVIVLRGSKASGKSYMMKQYIKRWLSLGGKVINIGCRRVLCEAQSNEWGIPYIGNAEEEGISLSEIVERDGGLSFVVDSTLKLQNVNWEKTLIILDEFEQFVNHLLTANTAVKDNRSYILQFLEDKLKECLATGGKIIGLDADASDLSCDWLEGFTGVKPFKLENIAKSHNNHCYPFSGDKEGYDGFIRELFAALEKGEKIFLASDNKKDLRAILSLNKTKFPDLPSALITSDTVAEKSIRDFITNPDESIKATNIVMLSGSPVMQSGVSINIKGHFDKVYGICTGVIEPSIMRQLLSRVRDNCDRYLWIADRAKGIYSNDFDYQKILESNETFNQSLKEQLDYITAVNKNLPKKEYKDKIQELFDSHDPLTDINAITKAKLTARRNLAMSNYRENFLEEVEEEGYVIHTDFERTASAVVGGDDITEEKKNLDYTDAINTFHADDLKPIEYKILKKKTSRTPTEQDQFLKYFIKDSLPAVVLDPLFILNFILKDRWTTINAVKRFWFTQNKEVAQNIDIKNLHYQVKVGLTGGKFWLEDLKPKTPYVELFERLGLSEFINNDLVVNKNSEPLKAFFERCKDYRKIKGIGNRELLGSCGVKFTNNIEVVNLLRKVVNLFGFKLKGVKKTKNEKGSPIRHYQVIQAVDIGLWTQLTDSFNIKYLNLEPINYDFDIVNNDDYDREFYVNTSFCEEKAVTNVEYTFESGSLPPDFIKENNSGDPHSIKDSVKDKGTFDEKRFLEPKLSLNPKELTGKKWNFGDYDYDFSPRDLMRGTGKTPSWMTVSCKKVPLWRGYTRKQYYPEDFAANKGAVSTRIKDNLDF